jgi:phage virion morphogenesis protein
MESSSDLEYALNALLKFAGAVVQKKIMRKVTGYLSRVNKKRIKQNKTPDNSAMEARHNKNKKGKMFNRMGRQLRQKYESDSAEIGFYGVAGNIATNHHLGKRVREKTTWNDSYNEFKMPLRELLGLPAADQNSIAEIIMKNLESYISTGKLLSVRGSG